MNQIRPYTQILESTDGLSNFDKLLSIIEEFCAYASKVEGIKAIAIHPHERESTKIKFNSLSLSAQEKKLNGFLKYYNHCTELVAAGISLRDKKTSLKIFMQKFGLVLPNSEEVFEVLDSQTFVEIYDLDFIQCYRSIDFLEATSHSMMALETYEWWELFNRASKIGEDIMRVVQGIYSGAISEPVFIPVESHTVKEIGSQSPLSSQADIILYSPVYDEKKIFQGGLHFFKIRSVYSLDFKLWN